MNSMRFAPRLLALFLTAALPAACVDDTAPRPGVVIVDTTGLDRMEERIRSGAFGRIEAVLVERSGQPEFEAYFGNTGADTRIDAKSVGKSITALAVGAAIDDGELAGVDVAVWDYLTNGAPVANDDPAKRAITVGDLLTMSSPLECNDWDLSSAGNEERMYRTDDWTRFALSIPVDPDFTRLPNGQARFSYCTAGVYLLGRVVEKATGEPFDTYVQARLFDPLGIPGAGWRRSPTGQVQSGGQLSMRAVDLARVGRMVSNGGEFGGRQVISRDWLRTMLTPVVGVMPDTDYARLWWTRNLARPGGGAPVGGALMLGNGGNMVLLVPEFDAVVVVLSTSYNVGAAYDRSIALVEDFILPALSQAAPGDEQ